MGEGSWKIRVMQRRCRVNKTGASEDRRKRLAEDPLADICIVTALASKVRASSIPMPLSSLPSQLLTLLSANVHAEG